MCKSEMGCFQELVDQTQIYSRTGCMELLPTIEPYLCLRLSPFVDSKKAVADRRRVTKRSLTAGVKKSEKTLLRCCREDMCNYVAQLQPELSISVKDPSPAEENGSRAHQSLITISTEHFASDKTSISRYPSWSDSRWFRLVVIGVPVAGGVILVVLIAFACALLKASDSKAPDERVLDSDYHWDSLPHRTRPKQTALIFTEHNSRPSVTVAFRD